MPYTVSAAPRIGLNGYTIGNLIQLMGGSPSPVNISLTQLGNPINTTSLGPHQGASIQFGINAEVVRSTGLITCASVCYVNAANGTGYVFHANAGHIAAADFQTAMLAIGAAPPYKTVYIAYAHQGNTDPGYQGTIHSLVAWGIPGNNIVEITNLFLNQSGLNNLLQLGY